MKTCRRALAAAFGVTLLVLASAHGEDPTQSDAAIQAYALIRSCLPPEYQHVFAPPEFKYEQTTNYLSSGERQPGHEREAMTCVNVDGKTFVLWSNPTEKQKKRLYRDEEYFRPDDPSSKRSPVLSIYYYPNGSRFSDSDHAGNIIYTRYFFPDGMLKEYTVWQGGKWLAGVAVDPVTKKANFFSNGTGSLRTYDSADTYETKWFANGATFAVEQVKSAKRIAVELWLGNDSLRRSAKEEELTLVSQDEVWTWTKNSLWVQIGMGQRNPPPRNADIRPLPGFTSGRPSEKIEEDKIRQEWSVAYPKRRSAFMKGVEALMTVAGQTWKSLDIEFLRDGAPWPGQ
jgi:hypothetical protein